MSYYTIFRHKQQQFSFDITYYIQFTVMQKETYLLPLICPFLYKQFLLLYYSVLIFTLLRPSPP